MRLIPRNPAPSAAAQEVNPLQEYFEHSKHRMIRKWMHYFDIYHRHLQRFRNEKIVVLEFGVDQGGSLQMWRNYFGRKALLYGVDIDPLCAEFECDRTEILIGDQEDRGFLRSVVARTGPIDVVIDDGGHHMDQQIVTFEEVYPNLSENGVYVVEDVHTSYWRRYGGGYRLPGTFQEYAKGLTDQLNAWHSEEAGFEVDDFTRTTRSIHFYDSVVVFERAKVGPPEHQRRGKRRFRRNAVGFQGAKADLT